MIKQFFLIILLIMLLQSCANPPCVECIGLQLYSHDTLRLTYPSSSEGFKDYTINITEDTLFVEVKAVGMYLGESNELRIYIPSNINYIKYQDKIMQIDSLRENFTKPVILR